MNIVSIECPNCGGRIDRDKSEYFANCPFCGTEVCFDEIKGEAQYGQIDELKDRGIKFYLDDFGTGYSNMERILELPFDIIKFDKSLVTATNANERSAVVVRSLASMFAGLDYSVLYEGVETDGDEQRCVDMSATYLQGYKYSHPIPVYERLKSRQS